MGDLKRINFQDDLIKMSVIIGHILAIGIGLSLGLIGGGGSVLAVPVFVYIMGVPTKSAIAMTLAVVGTVSFVGMIPHWKRGNVNIKTALIFGSTTMIGAFLGARLASLPLITPTLQMLLFSITMVIAAGLMIKRSSPSPIPLNKTEELSDYPPPVCKYCWLWLMTEGLGVGILTGLVGVGGGFAIVPALVLFAKIPMREAIGTSLLILMGNAVAGFLGYMGQVNLDYKLMVSFTFLACLGTLIGSHYSGVVKPQQLQKGFGYFLLAIAALILFQNRQVFQFGRSQQTYENPRNDNRIRVSSHPPSHHPHS